MRCRYCSQRPNDPKEGRSCQYCNKSRFDRYVPAGGGGRVYCPLVCNSLTMIHCAVPMHKIEFQRPPVLCFGSGHSITTAIKLIDTILRYCTRSRDVRFFRLCICHCALIEPYADTATYIQIQATMTHTEATVRLTIPERRVSILSSLAKTSYAETMEHDSSYVFEPPSEISVPLELQGRHACCRLPIDIGHFMGSQLPSSYSIQTPRRCSRRRVLMHRSRGARNSSRDCP